MIGEDLRPRVLIDKPVNLEQLSDELGQALCGSDTEVVAAEGADLTQAQLEAGYAAHVAVFPPDKAELLAALPDPAVDFAGFKKALEALLP